MEIEAARQRTPAATSSAAGDGFADGTSALTIYLVLLLCVPSALRLPALGGVGYPAAMVALALGLWWCWAQARGASGQGGMNPIKVALFCLLTAVLASYAWAMRRPLPAVEASQADIGILRILVVASVVLTACDGIANWERFLTLTRRVAIAGGAFAGLGLLQFLTGRSLIDWISIPGFVASQEDSLIERSGFTRAAATAMHPLEYAAGLAVFFPIALTIALYDTGRNVVIRWLPAALVAGALVLSSSRSGYLGLAIGVLVLSLSWPRRIAMGMAAAGVVVMVGVYVAIPGMAGTIRGMFLGVGNDPSTRSRSESYTLVEQFFAGSPLLGRGFGTFLPTYRILDNEVLLLLIETGLFGLISFFALGVSAIACALVARRWLAPELLQQLGQAVAAAMAAAMGLTLFFDAFSFPIAAGTLFLAAGLCGGYFKLALPDRGSNVAARTPLQRELES